MKKAERRGRQDRIYGPESVAIRACSLLHGSSTPVRSLASPFVRVVEKTEGLPKLEQELADIFKTGLPELPDTWKRNRESMWDFVMDQWTAIHDQCGPTNLAYLLARRLALRLQFDAARRLAKGAGAETAEPAMWDTWTQRRYIRPPLDSTALTGHILRVGAAAEARYWIVLTPECDFWEKKADKVLMASCIDLKVFPEYTSTWPPPEAQLRRSWASCSVEARNATSFCRDS